MFKKEVNQHARKIRTERNRFGICKKEYWFLDWVDMYIEILFLLNCELTDQCRTCRYLLGWLLEILEQKWDTMRFINFELALLLAKELKFIVASNTITDYYKKINKLHLQFAKRPKYHAT